MSTALTEPPEIAFWLHDHAPIHRISVSPGARVYPEPEHIQVIIQGDGAARLVAWPTLDPVIELAVTRDSVLCLKPDLANQVRAWIAFIQSDHNALPVQWEFEDNLPKDLGRPVYHEMFERSAVQDGVRMFPYVEVHGRRHYLRAL